jgi:hypothetical protein
VLHGTVGRMRESKYTVQTSAVKLIATVFWDGVGISLVEFLKRDATSKSERYVQTLKNLKQRIGRFRPNSKMTQVLTLPKVLIYHPPTSIFLAP